ncbi:hypothetical protein H2198_001790 [Neophaeococcomyces mojaviensis]|uniref:Uncharacterized protein n=1 Tax=Neophaeococcomyces mojaviensis TaxID=3383035 RepID=A0ACC3AG73_9EURO|nr:hypothetical protein H2198_001790 [Knufia sp. JES_112]
MGVLDSVRNKVKDHHDSAEIDHSHNDGKNHQKSETENWIEKGQGGDRRDDDQGVRGGSLTSADTQPALANPKVQDAIMNDPNRVGSVSQ